MLAYCLVVRKSSSVCRKVGEHRADSNSMTPIFKLGPGRRLLPTQFLIQSNLACQYSAFRREDGPQAEAFADWKLPTLLIVGQEDAIFPPEVIAEVQKAIPGSRMEVVPGAAHSAHFEQASVFNKLVERLFAEVRSGAAAGAAAD